MNTRKVMLLAFIVSLLVYACGPVVVTDECMGYNFDCGSELAEQLTVSYRGSPSETFSTSRDEYGLELITAEFVLYNMDNGQYKEVSNTTVATDRLSEPRDEYLLYNNESVPYIRGFGLRNTTDIDDPWGLITTEGANCFGLRFVFTYDNGAVFTILGWRDDSQEQLTDQNSLQGVAYMNKDEDFIRSNLIANPALYYPDEDIAEGGNTANVLYQRLTLLIALEDENKVSATTYLDPIPYKDYIEFTGKTPIDGGDGSYFADPDPSRCNIITSS